MNRNVISEVRIASFVVAVEEKIVDRAKNYHYKNTHYERNV